MSDEYWKYNEHTAYKHRLLSYYLKLWSSKLGSASEDLVFWDCFAGKGTYADGQPGSPLLVLEESEKCWNGKRRINLACVFIERKKDNFRELQENLRKFYPELENERWFAYNSDYIDVYQKAMNGQISELQSLIKKPTLFFLDPLGFKDIPIEIIRDMMSRRSCEVLITLMVESIKRHRNTSGVMAHFKKMLGTNDLSRLNDICSQSNPEKQIAEYYEERLKSHDGANVNFTRSFAMTPNRRSVVLYYLVFGTNHKAGLTAMYNSMRAVSNNEDFSYGGKQDGMTSLEYFIGDPLTEIVDWVHSMPFRIANLNTILYYTAQSEKTYSQKDLRAAVVRLIREGKLEFLPKDDRAKERGIVSDRYFRFIH